MPRNITAFKKKIFTLLWLYYKLQFTRKITIISGAKKNKNRKVLTCNLMQNCTSRQAFAQHACTRIGFEVFTVYVSGKKQIGEESLPCDHYFGI